jgi:hypothetical protein
MNAKVSEALGLGDRLGYVYDFGSSTELAWIPTPTLRPNNRSVAEHEAEFLPAQPGDRGGGGGEARSEE